MTPHRACLLSLLAAAVGVLIVAGCAKKKSAEPPTTSEPRKSDLDVQPGDEIPVPGGEVVVHLEFEPPILNVLVHPEAWTTRITIGLIHEPLVREDPGTYEYVPGLAEGWVVSDDNLTWTFQLREARWHDGKPFTSRDVAFTMEKIFDPEVRAQETRATFQPFGCDKWETPDERTFRITCQKPPYLLLSNLGMVPIMPAHAMGEGDFNKHPLNRKPLGTGPYKFDHWTPGKEIVLVRNDAYWGKKGHLDRLIYHYVQDPVTAVRLATRGELDFLARVREPQWLDNVQNDPNLKANFNKFSEWPNQHFFLVFNMKRKIFSDVRVRRAMAHLYDAEMIVEKVMRGMAKPISTIYHEKAPGYHDGLLPYPHDPERAAHILDEAGWKDTDGDGVRDRDGESFRFVFLLSIGSPTLEKAVTLYQQDLKKVGIDMEIRKIEWAQLIELMRKHEFDMVASGNVFFSPRMDPFNPYHSSQIEDGANYAAFANGEMDAALEAMRSETDEAKRVPLHHRIQEIAYEELPYLLTHAPRDNAIVHKRFRGVRTSALWYQLNEWWVPKRLQKPRP